MRDSAIAFINTLDDAYPTQWGGTKPWDAIQTAFDDDEVDTLYLLSDGKPNKDRNGGSWNSYDYNSTAHYYANQNEDSDIPLKLTRHRSDWHPRGWKSYLNLHQVNTIKLIKPH